MMPRDVQEEQENCKAGGECVTADHMGSPLVRHFALILIRQRPAAPGSKFRGSGGVGLGWRYVSWKTLQAPRLLRPHKKWSPAQRAPTAATDRAMPACQWHATCRLHPARPANGNRARACQRAMTCYQAQSFVLVRLPHTFTLMPSALAKAALVKRHWSAAAASLA